jgi:hypothetical protein
MLGVLFYYIKKTANKDIICATPARAPVLTRTHRGSGHRNTNFDWHFSHLPAIAMVLNLTLIVCKSQAACLKNQPSEIRVPVLTLHSNPTPPLPVSP